MAGTINGFQKWHCRIGTVDQVVVLTWAPSALAARRQVAEFEGVPLHWVSAQPMGAC
jgi:hypothetical protein